MHAYEVSIGPAHEDKMHAYEVSIGPAHEDKMHAYEVSIGPAHEDGPLLEIKRERNPPSTQYPVVICASV